MMNPHGSGASACRLNPVEPGLSEAAERMMTGIGWRGPFMIELLRDDAGTAQFMELNGRLWGSTALVRRAGFDYPAWAVAQALDPGFAPPGSRRATPASSGISAATFCTCSSCSRGRAARFTGRNGRASGRRSARC